MWSQSWGLGLVIAIAMVIAMVMAIFFVVTVLNIVGDGLRDALDPKLRQ